EAGRTELPGELPVGFARIAPGAPGDFRRQQGWRNAVLVGGPYGAVLAQECGAGALFTTEAQRAVDQAVDEPFEAHRHFVEPPSEFRRHVVDHLAADDGLADARIGAPARAVLK